MTIKERIAEASGLCSDLDLDLQRVQELHGARNPEASCETLVNSYDLLLTELTEHLFALLAHYEREAAKKARRS